MLHPNSYFQRKWELFVLLLILYNLFSIPFRFCFSVESHFYFYLCDYVTDAFLLVNICLHFFRWRYHEGILITDKKVVRYLYLKGWFRLDVFASFPLDLLVIALGFDHHWAIIPLICWRAPRLLWGLHIFEFFQNLEKNVQLSPAYIRLMKLVLAVFINAHWLGSFYFFIGTFGGEESWLTQQKLVDATLFRQYIRSVYWALTTMATVGFGDILPYTNAETIYLIFSEFVGVSIFAYIIGNIAILVANLDATAQAYRQKMDGVNNFLRLREVPFGLQDRVRNYYDYLWSRNKGIQEEEILTDLPNSLRTEVSMFLYRDVLAKVPLFQEANKVFLNALVKLLKPIIYSPNDYIIVQGEMGKEMYFIGHGTVEVCSSDGSTVYATLHDGAFFGEIALLFAEKRNASIRAVGFCDLFCLTREDLETVLQDYPEIGEKMKKIASERYKKNP